MAVHHAPTLKGRSASGPSGLAARLLERIPDAVLVVDGGKLEVTEANPAAEVLLGCSCAELLGRPLTELCADHETERALSRELRAAGDKRGARVVQALRFRTGSGTVFCGEVWSCQASEDDPSLRLVMLRDVTERVRLERELTARDGVVEAISQSPDLDDTIHNALQVTVELIGADTGAVRLLDETGQWLNLKASYGLSDELKRARERIAVGEGLAGRAVASGAPLLTRDYAQDERGLPEFSPEFHAAAYAPISVRGRVLGTLSVQRRTHREFSDSDIQLLVAIGNRLAMAVEKEHLIASVQHSNLELRARNSIAHALIQSLDLHRTLRRIVTVAPGMINASDAFILLLSSDRSELEGVAATGAHQEAFAQIRFPFPNSGSASQVLVEGKILSFADAGAAPGCGEFVDRFGAKSIIFAPMLVKDKPIGVMAIDDTGRRREFSTEEVATVEWLAGQAATAIHNAQLHEQVVWERSFSQGVIDHAGVGIVAVDRSRRVMIFNPMAEEITGWSRSEIQEHLWPDVLHPDAEARARATARIQRCFERSLGGSDALQPGAVAPVRAREWPIHVRGGTRRVVTLISTPITDAMGGIVAVLEVFEDVTEQKNMQQRWVQAERMAAVGQLASGVAHEFNNLIGVISGFAQLARASRRPETLQEALDTIVKTSDRAGQMTKNLLSFARPSVLKREPIDIGACIDSALNLVQREMQKARVAVDRDYPPDLPTVVADPGQIQQVLLNLFLNACHAMPEGGRLSVTVHTESDLTGEPWITIEVTDTGLGISREHLERIFEPFFTTKSGIGPGNVRGTGLGLSVARGIISAHQGTITVESEPGRGTTFAVRLPRRALLGLQAEPGGSEAQAAVAQPPQVAGYSPGSVSLEPEELQAEAGPPTDAMASEADRPPMGLSILVADDEPALCSMLKTMLHSLGHQVTTVPDGQAAIEALTRHKFDLIFTDLLMPKVGGTDVLQAARTLSSRPRAVVITGRGEDEIEDEILSAGAFACLRKPFGLEELTAILARVHAALASGDASV